MALHFDGLHVLLGDLMATCAMLCLWHCRRLHSAAHLPALQLCLQCLPAMMRERNPCQPEQLLPRPCCLLRRQPAQWTIQQSADAVSMQTSALLPSHCSFARPKQNYWHACPHVGVQPANSCDLITFRDARTLAIPAVRALLTPKSAIWVATLLRSALIRALLQRMVCKCPLSTAACSD